MEEEENEADRESEILGAVRITWNSWQDALAAVPLREREFANWVRTAVNHGWTTSKVAEMLGVTPEWLGEVLTRNYVPPPPPPEPVDPEDVPF